MLGLNFLLLNHEISKHEFLSIYLTNQSKQPSLVVKKLNTSQDTRSLKWVCAQLKDAVIHGTGSDIEFTTLEALKLLVLESLGAEQVAGHFVGTCSRE